MGKYSWSDKADERRESRRPKPVKKPTKIKNRTAQGAKEDRIYSELRKKYLEENPFCKAGLPGCTLNATEIHHKALRGKNYLNIETWLPACSNCHKYIHDHPKESYEKGLLISKFL